MNKTQTSSEDQSSAQSHDILQKSETLNRKYVSRPTIKIEVAESTEEEVAPEMRAAETVVISKFGDDEVEETAPAPDLEALPMTKSDIAEAFAKPEADEAEAGLDLEIEAEIGEEAIESAGETPDLPPETHPYQRIMNDVSVVQVEEEVPTPTPRELKNEAIRKALDALEQQQEEDAVEEIEEQEEVENVVKSTTSDDAAERIKPAPEEEAPSLSKAFKRERRRASAGKFVLAFATSAVCVGILGYFVSVNMPNISVRVAAMQSGIEATYPSYVPRDYQLSSVISGDDGTVNIIFGSDEGKFTLVEEKSSWDSNALLNNYVRERWGEEYTTLREQGVTIYVGNQGAAWVNGGILYKLTVNEGNLTKKQIKNIAISL